VKLEDYHNIYFLGIGGIGMSALGRWFLKKGLNVSGYDRTSTTLTNDLQKEGMTIILKTALITFRKWCVNKKSRPS
jgi:UDP-N-acetylmuramate--alanine ligase